MDGWTDGRMDVREAPSARPPIGPSAGLSGAENMALDLAMLRAARNGRTLLRLYRWDPPCLSFGRNEPALTRYDRTRIELLGRHTVRRPTGGRAVWHDAEVTYAVAAPMSRFGSLAESCRAIHRVIAAALQRLGVPASLAPAPVSRPSSLAAGACFASSAGGEVVVGSRKVVGSAQVRDGAALLQHGSILLQDGQDVVTQVMRGASVPVGATSLAGVLGRTVGFAEVAEAISAEAWETWRVIPGDEPRAPPDPALVARFSDPAWTWRR